MIVSKTNRFVFFHIPKNGGNSFRADLSRLQESGLPVTLEVHELLGKLDYAHIPLNVLHDHFPDTFKLAHEFTSFAIIRNPWERFLSALGQKYVLENKSYILDLSKNEILTYAREVIAEIREDAGKYNYKNVYFIPQSAFISYQGNQIVDFIFPLKRIEEFLAVVAEITGTSIASVEIMNATRKSRNKNIIKALTPIKPIVLKILELSPKFLRTALINIVYSTVTKNNNEKSNFLNYLKQDAVVREFVSSYYHDDFRLNEIAENLNACDFLENKNRNFTF